VSWAGQTVIRPQPDEEGLGAEHLVRYPRGRRNQAAGHGHVDAAGDQGGGQAGQPHPLQVHGHLGRFGREPADEVRGEHRADGRGDAQPHRARVAAGDTAHRGVRGSDLVKDDLRPGQQLSARASHRDPAGGAGEQRGARLALQAPDQLTQGRSGHVQALGGAAEMEFGSHRDERF